MFGKKFRKYFFNFFTLKMAKKNFWPKLQNCHNVSFDLKAIFLKHNPKQTFTLLGVAVFPVNM
jgi:hypothetical protein